jgi:hypothetical protein
MFDIHPVFLKKYTHITLIFAISFVPHHQIGLLLNPIKAKRLHIIEYYTIISQYLLVSMDSRLYMNQLFKLRNQQGRHILYGQFEGFIILSLNEYPVPVGVIGNYGDLCLVSDVVIAEHFVFVKLTSLKR